MKTQNKAKDYFINLKNISLHYQICGSGKPVILIHGNGEDLNNLIELRDYLAKYFCVYSVDSRCHGKSTWTDELSYDILRDDFIDFIKTLNLDKPSIVGHSDGGIIALLIACKDSKLINKIVCGGANATPNGLNDGFLDEIKEKIDESPYETKLRLSIMLDEPQISFSQLVSISNDTLILAGENDIIKESHTKWISDSITTSNYIIYSNEDHISYLKNGRSFNDIKDFLLK